MFWSSIYLSISWHRAFEKNVWKMIQQASWNTVHFFVGRHWKYKLIHQSRQLLNLLCAVLGLFLLEEKNNIAGKHFSRTSIRCIVLSHWVHITSFKRLEHIASKKLIKTDKGNKKAAPMLWHILNPLFWTCSAFKKVYFNEKEILLSALQSFCCCDFIRGGQISVICAHQPYAIRKIGRGFELHWSFGIANRLYWAKYI